MQVTRIHWEKNRFIYDLMYNRKVCGERVQVHCRDDVCTTLAKAWARWA
jgi:hypothetical protein